MDMGFGKYLRISYEIFRKMVVKLKNICLMKFYEKFETNSKAS